MKTTGSNQQELLTRLGQLLRDSAEPLPAVDWRSLHERICQAAREVLASRGGVQQNGHAPHD